MYRPLSLIALVAVAVAGIFGLFLLTEAQAKNSPCDVIVTISTFGDSTLEYSIASDAANTATVHGTLQPGETRTVTYVEHDVPIIITGDLSPGGKMHIDRSDC